MTPREMDLLEKSVKSKYSIPKEPHSLPELLNIISSIDIQDMKTDKIGMILSDAANNGHQEIVQALLDAKANSNFKSGVFEESVLSVAVTSGHKEIVLSLLTAKANVNIKSGFLERTALGDAIAHKKEDILQLLLEEKADPNIKDKDNHSPLHCATLLNRPPELIKKLLAGGSEVDSNPDKNNLSVLDLYISHYINLPKPDITDKHIDDALSVVNIMHKRGDYLKLEFNLYQFLRICNQRNPNVLNSLEKFCRDIKKSSIDDINKLGRKEVLELAPIYLNKLQVVLLSNNSEIRRERDFGTKLTSESVEKLYDRICKEKYPFWSKLQFIGVNVDVKPGEMNESKPSIFY